MEEQNQNSNQIVEDQEREQEKNNNNERAIKPVSDPSRKMKTRHPPLTSFKTKYPILLRELHPTLKMSFRLVEVFDSVVNHLYHRIVKEAKELAYLRKRSVIHQRDIVSACRLIFPPELCIHVEREASKSVRRYNAAATV